MLKALGFGVLSTSAETFVRRGPFLGLSGQQGRTPDVELEPKVLGLRACGSVHSLTLPAELQRANPEVLPEDTEELGEVAANSGLFKLEFGT